MPQPQEPARAGALSRRSFLVGTGGAAAGGVLSAGLLGQGPEPSADGTVLRGRVEIELDLNGSSRRVTVEPRTTLSAALRVHLEPPLTGTKDVCDRGNCGACTVLLDDRPAYACLLLAVDCVGRRVRTVEGLGSPTALSPVQEAFWACDAAMCGFCTPGLVVAATACLERDPAADDDAIRRGLAGNVCRCGTYPHVFQAVRQAGERMRRASESPEDRR